jgi:predicted aspartyl protease
MKTVAFCLASLAGLIIQEPAWGADMEQCSLKRVAELPVKSDHGRLLIPVKIEGRDAWVQVDTGSPFSMISARLANELNLHKSAIDSGRAYDAAGKNLRHYVRIKKLMLNGMTAENREFIVMGEDAPTNEALPYDGIFGANFLAAYDVELDIPHGKINLFTQDHCKGQVVYWTQDYVAVPFALDASLHMVMTATLEGKSVRAMVDTGAGPSILGAQTARRAFDVDPAGSGQQPDGEESAGTGAVLAFYKHRFGVLDIGGVAFHNTELFIIPDKTSRIIREHRTYDDATLQSDKNEETPLVIGMHHLGRIRAYIAYGEQRIYISSADAK